MQCTVRLSLLLWQIGLNATPYDISRYMSILAWLRRVGFIGYIKLGWIILSVFLMIQGLLVLGAPLLAIVLLGFAKDSLDIIEKGAEFLKPKSARQPVDTAFLLTK